MSCRSKKDFFLRTGANSFFPTRGSQRNHPVFDLPAFFFRAGPRPARLGGDMGGIISESWALKRFPETGESVG